MSNGGQMINERNLVQHIRAVMAPANPVPHTAYQSGEVTVPPVTDLLASGDAETQPVSIGIADGAGRAMRPERRSPAWRVLAPALSGAAVIAVAASLALANAAAPRPSSSGSAARAAAAGAPSAYLTINGRPGHSGLIVHNSRTGAIIVSAKEPYLKGTVPAVAAAGPGKREQFTVLRWTSESGKPTAVEQVLSFSHGKLVSEVFTALGFRGPSTKIEGVARCGAGLVVALGIPRAGGGLTPQIKLLAGAQIQTWSAPGTAAVPSDLSCVGTDKLAFLLTDAKTSRGQVRELDLTAPGHSLLASKVVARSGGKLGTILTAFASQRGGPIVATTFVKSRHHDHRLVEVRLVAISPNTGKVVRLFETFFEGHLPGHRGVGLLEAKSSCRVTSLDSTGHHALINCGGLHRLDNGKFTNLPNKHGKFGSPIIAAVW